MFGLLGTVLFGVGTSLNTKVIVDRLVFDKKDPKHTKMALIGILFMLIGEGLRQIEKGPETQPQEVEE